VVEAISVDDTGVGVGGDDGRLTAVDERPYAENDDAELALTGSVSLDERLMLVNRCTIPGWRSDQQACRQRRRRINNLTI